MVARTGAVNELIDDRSSNRGTLARQLLLERIPIDPFDAIERLVGLQAQIPLDPYTALWSRIEGFDPRAVGAQLEDRSLVRIVVMRGTIHLVTSRDARWMRPVTQPVMDQEILRHSEYAPLLVGVDLEPVLTFAREALAETPMAARALRSVLAAEFPDLDAAALAYACRCHLPLVQIPPRGVWGKTLQVTSTPFESWTGQELDTARGVDELLLRYLGAYGPASVADFTTFTRLTGLREVVERNRGILRTFHSATGVELFDLPDAPRPSADTPAPVRFLPEYDNLLLSHAVRTRFGSDESRRFADAEGPVRGTVLVDGTVQAVWHPEQVDGPKGPTRLVVEHLPLGAAQRDDVESEAAAFVAFRYGDGEHEVQLRKLG